MTNPYLDRLQGRIQEKHHPSLPSKPSKPGFEGIEGNHGCKFFENAFQENTTPTNLQNLQNVRSPSVPGGAGCKGTVIEVPVAGLRYRRAYAHLQLGPPALIDVGRWRQCVEDGRAFLGRWGSQAESLGWDSRDLFGLHTPPERPYPSYQRLSRYDSTGLCWLLDGREVIALTGDTASIRNADTGSVTIYRRFNKPALGPLSDSLDDLK
jgi:hypothetical protein